jgi:hypothetical protein
VRKKMGPSSFEIKCDEIVTKYKDQLHLSFVGDEKDKYQFENVFKVVSSNLIN